MNLQKVKTYTKFYQEHGFFGTAKAVFYKITKKDKTVLHNNVNEIWTEYMSWLSYANAGMLERGNVFCFDYAIRNLSSHSPIVEIGSFCGLSTNMMTYLKDKYQKTNSLITCDKWIFEGSEKNVMLGDSRHVTHAEYRDFSKTSFIRNAKLFSKNDLPYTIEAFSDEFFESWQHSEKRTDVFGRTVQLGGPISFCYIDGNHSYEFAKRDFENCDKYLENGGFLLFDDSADGSGWEVCRVVQEVAATGRYVLIAKNPNYFFQKK